MLFYGFSKINLLIFIPLEKHGDAQTHKLANIDFSYNRHRVLQIQNSCLFLVFIDSNHNHVTLKSMSKTPRFVYMCNIRMSFNDLKTDK